MFTSLQIKRSHSSDFTNLNSISQCSTGCLLLGYFSQRTKKSTRLPTMCKKLVYPNVPVLTMAKSRITSPVVVDIAAAWIRPLSLWPKHYAALPPSCMNPNIMNNHLARNVHYYKLFIRLHPCNN